MSLLPFLIVTLGGAAAALLLRHAPRVMAMVGVASLGLALVFALLIRPDDVLVIGGSGLATTAYLRLFLVLGTVVMALLALVGSAAGGTATALPVSLGVLGTSAFALALPDARLAVIAATAGGAFTALLCVIPTGDRAAATIGTRVLRATIVAGAMAISAAAWIGRDLSDLAARPVVFGLAYLAMALAVAIRFGAIPLHAWAARLVSAIDETELPLVTAWAPAALAVVALAWADSSIAPLLVDVDAIRLLVVGIALASIVLASVAAWIQDDLEHVVGYSIIGDAGVVMLAIAALDPEVWAPARTWILALVATRSAFAAWAGAVRATYGTGRLRDVRGWAIRSPLLAIGFAVVVLASIGLPGFAAYDARSAILDAALAGPLLLVAWVGVLSPLAYYARLGLVGVDRTAGGAVARDWRPVIRPLDLSHIRGWLGMTWSDNRVLTAGLAALLLAVLGLGVAAGMFGGPEAAAGLPPAIEGGTESIPTDGGLPPEPGPGASFEVEPSIDIEPDGSFEVEPSFEPVPTPEP